MGADGLDEEDLSPGWDAIDAACARLYPDQKPKHYGTLRRWTMGGRDPLDGISAYKCASPVAHWHFVTYGLSELYAKETNDAETSGFGFELTFRLACCPDDAEPPAFALNFLQNLARYVFDTGNAFDDGHWMSANGPIARDTDTAICSMGFVFDPQLPAIDTPNGQLAFLQIVGLTADEEKAARSWKTRPLLELLLPHMPLWITDLARRSLLEREEVRAQVDEGVRRDGSSCGSLFVDVLSWRVQDEARAPAFEITLGAGPLRDLLALLPLRLPFDRDFHYFGHDTALRFRRGDVSCVNVDDDVLTLQLTDATCEALLRGLEPRAGRYAIEGLEGVSWVVEKTVILDGDGNPVEVIGDASSDGSA